MARMIRKTRIFALHRLAFVAVCLAAAPVAMPQPALADPTAAAVTGAADEVMSTGELMDALALDTIFAHFGTSIADAPRQQGAPFNAAIESAWLEAARQTFVPARMHRDLATLLDDKFSTDDQAAFAAFYGSELGRRVSAADRAIADIAPEAQATIQEAGERIGAEASETRHTQITELLSLIGGDLSAQMVRESLRGMLIGMSLATQGRGDIVVPWEEIEFQLDAIMPQMETEIAASQKALAFFGYRDLSDEDVAQLIEFLRSEPARRLYAVVVYAVSEVMAERMRAFGQSLAGSMARVNV